MHFIRNNPVHRNSNLLYEDSSRRSQHAKYSPVAYPSSSGRPQSRLSTVGEDAPPCIPSDTSSFPGYVAVDKNPQRSPPNSHVAMEFITPNVQEYFSYSLPNTIPRPPPPQDVSYLPFDAGLVSYPDCTFPEHLSNDVLLDLFEIPRDLFTAQLPPSIPPTVPEQELPPHPPFGYHQCGWMSGPPCNGLAPGKNREMAEHLRVCHHFIGHERDVVNCEWENCGQTMQRMNVPRHIVSRHLLEAACCRICAKRFSRPDVVSRHEKTCGRPPAGTSSRKPQKVVSRSCDF